MWQNTQSVIRSFLLLIIFLQEKHFVCSEAWVQSNRGMAFFKQLGQNQLGICWISNATSRSIFRHLAWYVLFSLLQTKITSCEYIDLWHSPHFSLLTSREYNLNVDEWRTYCPTPQDRAQQSKASTKFNVLPYFIKHI